MYGSTSDDSIAEIQVPVTYGELYSGSPTEKRISWRSPCPSCVAGMPTCTSTDMDKEGLYPCKECYGKQFIEEIKKVNFSIPPGAKDGDELKIRDANKNAKFVIKQIPHPYFNRNNDDLLLSMRITLDEALNGFRIPVLLPNNSTIIIKSPTDCIIEHDSIYTIPDAGFPGANKNRGALHIHFFVDIAKLFEENMEGKLAHVLAEDNIDCSDAQEVTLEDT